MAVFNSNLVAAGQQTKSIPPGTAAAVFGSVSIGASTTLSQVAPDTIQICSAPGPSSHLVAGWFDFPEIDSGSTLRMSFGDGTNVIVASTALTTWTASRYVLETAGVATHAKMGSGLTWTVDTPLFWTVTTSSGAATVASIVVIYFCLWFAQD